MTTDNGQLPVAEPAVVRRAALRLVRADRRAFAVVLVVNALAAGGPGWPGRGCSGGSWTRCGPGPG